MAARKHKGFFTKVRVARELLKEKSEDILKEYLDVVQQAKVAGDYESAYKALQWLIEHMPADDDGSRLVEQSVDKKQEASQQQTGPAIQIGIAVGGLCPQRQISLKKPEELPTVTAEVVEDE